MGGWEAADENGTKILFGLEQGPARGGRHDRRGVGGNPRGRRKNELQIEAASVPGVLGSYDIRARWVGHRLFAEMSIAVNAGLTVAQGHRIAELVQHRLVLASPKLQQCLIHVEPFQPDDAIVHEVASE